MKKFQPLADYCQKQTRREFELSFPVIEGIISDKLPATAEKPQYWANVVSGGGPVRAAMRETAYDTFLVSGSRRVRFERRS